VKPSDVLLGVRATALRLNVHENTVRNWANWGILPVGETRPSGFRRFRASDVEQLRITIKTTGLPISRGVSDYSEDAPRPRPGTLWVWEPEKAPELIRVTRSRWNGEQWWVATRRVSQAGWPEDPRLEVWNELNRFWNACYAVALHSGVLRSRSHSGPPGADELEPPG
jgi:helix-turn-helix protein